MKNFTKGTSTLIGKVPEGTPYKKAKDMYGKYEKGQLTVYGYIKTHSERYNRDAYVLCAKFVGDDILINVPEWYGKKLDADFQQSGQSPEEYFENGNVSIELIEPFTTNNGNTSVSITIYED